MRKCLAQCLEASMCSVLVELKSERINENGKTSNFYEITSLGGFQAFIIYKPASFFFLPYAQTTLL